MYPEQTMGTERLPCVYSLSCYVVIGHKYRVGSNICEHCLSKWANQIEVNVLASNMLVNWGDVSPKHVKAFLGGMSR